MDPAKAREMYGKMTDAERAELAAKLDAQLDEYIDGLEASGQRYMDGWNEVTSLDIESHTIDRIKH